MAIQLHKFNFQISFEGKKQVVESDLSLLGSVRDSMGEGWGPVKERAEEGFLCGKNADGSERKCKLGKLEGASEVENWESTLDKGNNGEATGGVG